MLLIGTKRDRYTKTSLFLKHLLMAQLCQIERVKLEIAKDNPN